MKCNLKYPMGMKKKQYLQKNPKIMFINVLNAEKTRLFLSLGVIHANLADTPNVNEYMIQKLKEINN